MSDVKITIREGGSLKVEGDVAIFDHEGNQLETNPDRPISLCRCGASANKPFCDGSHKSCGWDGTLA